MHVKELKQVQVVAAIICKDDKIFVTQQGYGDYQGMWEFPGGKVELGESSEAALVREIKEELNVSIRVGEWIGTVEYDYPTFHMIMRTYLCAIVSGEIELLEHEVAKWVILSELSVIDWLAADKKLIADIACRLERIIKL